MDDKKKSFHVAEETRVIVLCPDPNCYSADVRIDKTQDPLAFQCNLCKKSFAANFEQLVLSEQQIEILVQDESSEIPAQVLNDPFEPGGIGTFKE